MGSRSDQPLWGGAWLTPKTIPHTCYRVKFGSFATKGVRINRKKPPKLRNAGACPLAAGAWLTPRNTLLPICVILPNLVVLGQTVRALLRRSA